MRRKPKTKKYLIKGDASDKQIEDLVDLMIEESVAKKGNKKRPFPRKKTATKKRG